MVIIFQIYLLFKFNKLFICAFWSVQVGDLDENLLDDDVKGEKEEINLEEELDLEEMGLREPKKEQKKPEAKLEIREGKNSVNAWNLNKKDDNQRPLSWLKKSKEIKKEGAEENHNNGEKDVLEKREVVEKKESTLAKSQEKLSKVAKYRLRERVEAVWYEDYVYYLAEILRVEKDGTYNIVFVEYGNEQITEEKDIRPIKKAPAKLEKPSVVNPPKSDFRESHQERSSQKPSKLNNPFLVNDRESKLAAKNAPVKATKNVSAKNALSKFSERDSSFKARTASFVNKGNAKEAQRKEFEDQELQELINNAEDLLNKAREKLQVSVSQNPNANVYASLANVFLELAVLPVYPMKQSAGLFEQAMKQFETAATLDSNPTVLLKYAHGLMRFGIFCKENENGSQANSSFMKAMEKYNMLFVHKPEIEVIKFLLLCRTEAPTLTSTHFLGIFDNGYSELLQRCKEQESLFATLEYHWQKVLNWKQPGGSSSEESTSLHPIFRYHCFEALKSLVTGIEEALVDADEDIIPPADLLLWMYGNLNKLHKVQEANVVALWLLKLSEKFHIAALSNAVETLKKDVRASYVKQLNEGRKDKEAAFVVNKKDLEERMQRELADIKYSNEGLLGVVLGIHGEISDEEFKRVVQNTSSMNIADIDLKELSKAAASSYNLSQLLAASAFESLLVGEAKENSNVRKAIRAILEDEGSLKLICHLATLDSYETSLSATRALVSILQSIKFYNTFFLSFRNLKNPFFK